MGEAADQLVGPPEGRRSVCEISDVGEGLIGAADGSGPPPARQPVAGPPPPALRFGGGMKAVIPLVAGGRRVRLLRD